MKKRTAYSILGTLALIFAIWLTIVLISAIQVNARSLWFGMGFTAIAFALSEGALYLASSRHDPGATEINGISVLFSVVYFGVALAANTLFCILQADIMPMVITNLLLLAVFVICEVFAADYLNKANVLAGTAKQKIAASNRISAQIGMLMQYTDNQEIKSALRSLKEQADYADNVPSVAAGDIENEVLQRLPELKDMLKNRSDAQLILYQIKEISVLLKERSVCIG